MNSYDYSTEQKLTFDSLTAERTDSEIKLRRDGQMNIVNFDNKCKSSRKVEGTEVDVKDGSDNKYFIN